MAEVHTFYSRDSAELKIGVPVKGPLDDGTEHTIAPAEIVFHNGFASVEMTERNLKLIAHTRSTFPLEDLGPDTDLAPEGAPGSVVCPICGRTFKAPLGLNSHMRTHKE